MCILHLIDNNGIVGNESGSIYVKKEAKKSSFPIETVDGINVYGKTQITTQCIEECMHRGIPISFFSYSGSYIGGFASTYTNVKRQRLQSNFNKTDVSFELAKKIIEAKISNQITALRRYNRTTEADVEKNIVAMRQSYRSISKCTTVAQLMGYEGIAARYYFEGLGKVVKPEFYFSKRSKNPPQDHFNALLSFGYSLLYKELYGVIVSKGLNPYFGFIHEDKENHPALVSDMLEEWRAVIIDSMILSLINGNEIFLDAFEEGTLYLKDSGRRKVIEKYNKKMETIISYVDNYSNISYRSLLSYQIQSLVHVIEDNNHSYYSPIRIR